MEDPNGGSDRAWFPPAVAQFVDHVESGKALKSTEFAGAVSVTNSNRFREAGRCRYDSGAILGDGKTVMLLFQCRTPLLEQGIAAFLSWDGEKVTRIELMANEILPGSMH